MIDFKQQYQPREGEPIVWVVVEKATGHISTGLSDFNEDIEAQFLDSGIEVFWEPAYEAREATLSAAIRSANVELAMLPKHQKEIEDRKLTFIEAYDRVTRLKAESVNHVRSQSGTEPIEDGDSGNG